MRIAICVALVSTAGCAASTPASAPASPQPGTAPGRAAAPAGTGDLASVVGVWRGTSLCTVRPSPCNDETVVYHVSGTDPDHVLADAYKIVDGKEVEMGSLPCQLAADQLVCRIERGVFRFAIEGGRMHGTLDLLDGTRYRVIEVERAR